MLPARLLRKDYGFTIVELVTVLVVLGILSLGSMSFLNNASNGYAATLARSQLAEDARLIMVRLGSELRRALPRSVRVQGDCLEYVPTLGGSSYLNLPTASAAAAFDSWPVDPVPTASDLRVAVYPTSSLYALANPGAISPLVTLGAPDADNRVAVSMASAHQFAAESPQRKYFLVADPVSYCISAGWLFRYSGYGFSSSQPSPATLPAALPNRSVYGQGVSGGFSLSAATLSRNSEVALTLQFTRGEEQIEMNHLVQVRNAP